MMRSDFIMKLMSVVLFVAVAAYIGLYLYQSAKNPLRTEPAARYTVEESGKMEGCIIRNETVLGGDNGVVTLMAGEGEKLGAGQAVAVYYEGEAALERASEIRSLQIQIKDAEAATAASAALTASDTENCVLALSDAVEHQQYDQLQDLSYSVRQYVFTNSAGKLSEDDRAALELRLNNLLSESTNTRTVYAPVSGVFSSAVDGYENLTPDSLGELTPSSLREMEDAAPTETGSLGKLITGITWYYAAVLDSENAEKLEGKKSATLQFTKTYFNELEMKIESIGEEINGQRVAVFSARRGLSETAALRELTAEVEFSSYSGLFVPEEAVHRGRHDRAYIYLLTGQQAELVYVQILCPVSGGYIVRDGGENGTVLREGSDIIVAAGEIYDGKVVTK